MYLQERWGRWGRWRGAWPPGKSLLQPGAPGAGAEPGAPGAGAGAGAEPGAPGAGAGAGRGAPGAGAPLERPGGLSYILSSVYA